MAAPRIAERIGMPASESSGAITRRRTSTINQAPTNPATIAPSSPPGMPRLTSRSPINPAMAPTRSKTSRCVSVISSLQLFISLAITRSYRQPRDLPSV
jgi:hypothetical protein